MVEKTHQLDSVQETQEVKKKLEEIIKENSIKVIKLKELNIQDKIGEGGQAKVYKGKYDNNPVAVKIISDIDLRCFINEIVILSKISHPNIPKFYGMLFEDNYIGMVMHFIMGKSLDEVEVEEIPIETKMSIIKSLSCSLAYIHSKNYIHRDLKPENLLIENTTMKLFIIDFGIAKMIIDENSKKTRAKGTIYYLAPDIFDISSVNEKREIISKVSTKVDVWAFGCIVSYLFSGFLPWCNKYKNKPEVIQKLLMKKEKFPVPDTIKDESIKKIISMCVENDLNKRATIIKVKEILDTIEA